MKIMIQGLEFVKIGGWELAKNENGIKFKPDFDMSDSKINNILKNENRGVLYVFIESNTIAKENNAVRYIGTTKQIPAIGRFGNNHCQKKNIKDSLKKNKLFVFVYLPDKDIKPHRGLKLNLALGLEYALIDKIPGLWNTHGTNKKPNQTACKTF